jgi:hypothetical protein
MSSINGIEAVELLASADPALADAARKRGRKPVVERTAAQPLTLNGIEGVIFGTETSGPGSVFRLDSADPAAAQAARQRGQRVLVVVDSTGAVVPLVAAPVNTVLPVISGGSSPPKTNEQLTASTGTWTGSPTPTYTYQWKADGVAIGGATTANFTLTVTQEGTLVTVTVTGTNSQGSASATSEAVGPVDPADVTAPTLSNLVATRTGDTTATLEVDTNEGNGTIWFLVVNNGDAAPTTKAHFTPPHTGYSGTVVWADDVAVSTIDTYGGGPTGLVAANQYDAYAFQEDAAGNDSNVVSDDLASATWSPAALFSGGATGAWYDPSDLSTVFQDTAGTTPAVANDPVGRINDKSGGGFHLLQATAGARPLLKTDGTLYWLETDGTDDFMSSATTVSVSSTNYLAMCARRDTEFSATGFGLNKATADYFRLNSVTTTARGGATARMNAKGLATMTINGTNNTWPLSVPGVSEGIMIQGGTNEWVLNGSATTGANGWATPQTDTAYAYGLSNLTPTTFHAFAGRFYGMLGILNSIPSAPDRALIRTYLGAKGGITI